MVHFSLDRRGDSRVSYIHAETRKISEKRPRARLTVILARATRPRDASMVLKGTNDMTLPYRLVIGTPDGRWTTLAYMGSKIEIQNRMGTVLNALTFLTEQPFALIIVDVKRHSSVVSRTENHGLTLTEIQELIKKVLFTK